MKNSVFGKIMENIRNDTDIKLVRDQVKYIKYMRKPNFKDGDSFSKELFAAEMGKNEIKMKKPVCLGKAMLELSKTLVC